MITVKSSNAFSFKQFTIKQEICSMKVNTDGVLLGAWVATQGHSKILDIGTGTGVIALMLAQRSPDSTIVGLDIDHNAYLESNENVSQSKYSHQISIIEQSVQDFARNSTDKFDLVVSNPPFFTGGTFSANENKANVRHAIKLPHGDLLISVNQILSANGVFAVILPYIEGLRFIELAERAGLHANKITEVKHKEDKPIERLLMEFAKKKSTQINDELCIKSDDGASYSLEFQELTKEFYLHF